MIQKFMTKLIMEKERNVGEIFEEDGKWYQCIKGDNCTYCSFDGDGRCRRPCVPSERNDNTSVIFKELRKIGEPFIYNHENKRLVKMQEYGLFDLSFCKETDTLMIINDYNLKRISIEIKQDKEDMEEKYSELTDIVHEYMDKDMTYKDFKEAINDWVDDYIANKESNKPTLKRFDLQKAKNGKPVCTRNGKRARIICFDAKGVLPIIALVESGDEEKTVRYSNSGRFRFDGMPDEEDLMMLPEKKEGWVNVMEGTAGKVYVGNDIYRTEDEAKEGASRFTSKLIANVPIEWE